MPWNPEHYSVKPRGKKKLLPLKDHYIPGVTEKPKPTHSEEMQDKLEPIPEDVDCAQADNEN